MFTCLFTFRGRGGEGMCVSHRNVDSSKSDLTRQCVQSERTNEIDADGWCAKDIYLVYLHESATIMLIGTTVSVFQLIFHPFGIYLVWRNERKKPNFDTKSRIEPNQAKQNRSDLIHLCGWVSYHRMIFSKYLRTIRIQYLPANI